VTEPWPCRVVTSLKVHRSAGRPQPTRASWSGSSNCLTRPTWPPARHCCLPTAVYPSSVIVTAAAPYRTRRPTVRVAVVAVAVGIPQLHQSAWAAHLHTHAIRRHRRLKRREPLRLLHRRVEAELRLLHRVRRLRLRHGLLPRPLRTLLRKSLAAPLILPVLYSQSVP